MQHTRGLCENILLLPGLVRISRISVFQPFQ